MHISKQTSLSCDVFTRRVMGRIYLIYFLRKLSRPVVIESIFLGACMVVISLMVSLSHVISNAEHVPDAPAMLPLFRFFWSAFLDTNNIVKILTITFMLTSSLFVYSIMYSFFKCFFHRSGRLIGQIFFRQSASTPSAQALIN